MMKEGRKADVEKERFHYEFELYRFTCESEIYEFHCESEIWEFHCESEICEFHCESSCPKIVLFVFSKLKRLQSADHICNPLQQKRWTKRLQSARRRLFEVKSELGGVEQAKSKLGEAEQAKSNPRLSQMEQRSPVAGGEGNRRRKALAEGKMAAVEENQRRYGRKWLEVDGPSLYHAEDAQAFHCLRASKK
ncbi:hypothetical protein LXL04_031417 [Taraxacum kok-saghyz]